MWRLDTRTLASQHAHGWQIASSAGASGPVSSLPGVRGSVVSKVEVEGRLRGEEACRWREAVNDMPAFH